jgi:hypothetical protein
MPPFRPIVLGIALFITIAAPPMPAHADVTVTPIPDATDTTSTPTAPTTQPTAATAEEAQSLVDAGKYKEALKILLHLLDLRGPAVTFDRQQMLILRAECQVQMHANVAALGSLDVAHKEAVTLGADDDAAQAAAFTYLIQKSPRDIFVPQTGSDRKPIDILDRTARKTAYAELFADTFSADQQKLKAALSSNTLPPLADLAKDVPYLGALEHVSAGTTVQTDAFSKKASGAATRLVSSTLADFQSQVSHISTEANEVVNMNTSAGAYSTQYRHAGLTADQIRTLKNIGTTCEQMTEVLSDFGKAFGNADLFHADVTRAANLKDQIRDILNKDYNTMR